MKCCFLFSKRWKLKLYCSAISYPVDRQKIADSTEKIAAPPSALKIKVASSYVTMQQKIILFRRLEKLTSHYII